MLFLCLRTHRIDHLILFDSVYRVHMIEWLKGWQGTQDYYVSFFGTAWGILKTAKMQLKALMGVSLV